MDLDTDTQADWDPYLAYKRSIVDVGPYDPDAETTPAKFEEDYPDHTLQMMIELGSRGHTKYYSTK